MNDYSATQTAQATAASTYIGDFTVFLNNTVVPFLFVIALLFFLWNIARYFIIDARSSDTREKAKRSAIYGIAALVLLVSLWGLVNLLVSGLGLNEGRSMCPDFMGGWCGSVGTSGVVGGGQGTFPVSGNGGFDRYGDCLTLLGDPEKCTPAKGGSTLCTDPLGNPIPCSSDDGNRDGGEGGTTTRLCNLYRLWVGIGNVCKNDNENKTEGGRADNGKKGDPRNNDGAVSRIESALAKIIYGSYEDKSEFSYRTGAPRSINSSVSIPAQTVCVDGLNTLQLSAQYENAQTAYLLYKNAFSGAKWFNVTDLHGLSEVVFDGDNINELLSQNIENLVLVHTHPSQSITLSKLNASGHPISAKDMEQLCANANIDEYWVVDENNTWKASLTDRNATCPFTNSDDVVLQVVQTLLQLSVVEASERQAELSKMYNRYDIPADLKNALLPYLATDYNSLNRGEIITMADTLARTVGITVSRENVQNQCFGWFDFKLQPYI